jgi:hypothetical protein
MMKTKNINKILILCCSLFFIQCTDEALDKTDLGAISADVIWSDPHLAEGFVNNIYVRSLPGWNVNASKITDDAQGTEAIMYGEAQPGSQNIYGGSYTTIKDINILLRDVGTGTIPVDDQNLMKGQALFFRAYLYFRLVSTYGGVPLIVEVKDQSDVEALKVPRNKTSEVMAQIITDINAAIVALPPSYGDDSDYGRITKGAAMAMKGRILLHYASEQFDPTQSAGRWQAALDANNAALTHVESQGKGLHSDYAELWFEEGNSNVEAIMARNYSLDKSHNREAGCRPFIVGTNGESYDKPTKGLVDAFPMKDGKAIDDVSSAYIYDATALWLNRDPRFEASIAWNGSIWPLNNPAPMRTSDLEWTFAESAIEGQSDSRITATSFNCRKAVDGTLEGGAASLSSPTDWIEIRFTEVLLNLAEASNEVGSTAIAYDVLTQIRNRAGIDAGVDNLYGIPAGLDQAGMRDVIMLERRLELVFEGKRSQDLRRRRMYSTLNGTRRFGYQIIKTAAFDALSGTELVLDDRVALETAVLDGSIDLDDPAVYNTYFETNLRSLERFGSVNDLGDPINYLDQYYFYDIPQGDLDKNINLTQTAGWPGGTFDPLQ